MYAADVRDRYAMRAASEDFRVRFGGADIVIGSAGVSAGTLTERADDHPVFQEILDINVVGLFNTFQPFLPQMRKAASGTLVGMASVAGFRGLPGAGAYSASKAAAIAYLESLRVELRGSGVSVVTICPGYIATPMTAAQPLSDAVHAAARGRGAAHGPCDRAAQALDRDPVADGAGRRGAQGHARRLVRLPVRARASQAPAG